MSEFTKRERMFLTEWEAFLRDGELGLAVLEEKGLNAERVAAAGRLERARLEKEVAEVAVQAGEAGVGGGGSDVSDVSEEIVYVDEDGNPVEVGDDDEVEVIEVLEDEVGINQSGRDGGGRRRRGGGHRGAGGGGRNRSIRSRWATTTRWRSSRCWRRR